MSSILRFKRVLLAVVCFVPALLGAPAPASAEEATYIVRERDTLSHIAVRTGVSVAELVAANGLDNPHDIKVDVALTIPSGGASPAGTTVVYVVQSGDTLSHIAVRTGSSSRELADLNGLSDRHAIRVGQELQVPTSGGISSVGTAKYRSLPDRITSRPERLALVPYFEKWALANGVPVDLLMAVAWQESGWNNEAVSFKGAVGVGQIMPATGVWVATDLIGRPELDPTIPEDNIRMSARFIRWLLDYVEEDENLAIAGYYQGPGSVSQGELFGSTELYVANVQVHRQFFVATL
ncbi:MAG: LysM repeat protein [Acidimicrobiales bacterium]|jgi:LysM repeat protein